MIPAPSFARIVDRGVELFHIRDVEHSRSNVELRLLRDGQTLTSDESLGTLLAGHRCCQRYRPRRARKFFV
jgi:hypothetical protein